MAFFNEMKDMFNKAAQSVTSKTKEGMEISRLSSESRGVSNELSALYTQIGRIYVDSRGADNETMAPLAARAVELQGKLEELERQKMQLKNQNRCPACGVVMPKNARFCSSCGRRMPETIPETEPVPADVHYCPECGAMLSEADGFCAVCGHDQKEKPEAPRASQVITRTIVFRDDGDDDEAPTDFEAD